MTGRRLLTDTDDVLCNVGDGRMGQIYEDEVPVMEGRVGSHGCIGVQQMESYAAYIMSEAIISKYGRKLGCLKFKDINRVCYIKITQNPIYIYIYVSNYIISFKLIICF